MIQAPWQSAILCLALAPTVLWAAGPKHGLLRKRGTAAISHNKALTFLGTAFEQHQGLHPKTCTYTAL